MIHCIGDSHSAVFSGKEEMQPIWPEKSDDRTPFFKSYRIGPATAYQLSTKKYLLDEIIKTNYKENDYLLFCFGEVDIRAHLIKQSQLKNESIETIVKDCVERYFDVINNYKKEGYNVIAWGPIASWHESKRYTGGPSYGTSKERNFVTKLFNEYLEDLCLKNNIVFVTIFNKMLDENNETKPEYLDNWEGSHIHLSQTSLPLIMDAFQEKNLI